MLVRQDRWNLFLHSSPWHFTIVLLFGVLGFGLRRERLHLEHLDSGSTISNMIIVDFFNLLLQCYRF